jgi:DNA-binding protein HU-beta
VARLSTGWIIINKVGNAFAPLGFRSIFAIPITDILFSKHIAMNKAELIDAIASSAKITKSDAQRALDATIENVTKALKKGDKVSLVGFGTFSVAKRAARTGRNPQTGKAIKIAAKKVAKFKAGIDLAKTVNK